MEEQSEGSCTFINYLSRIYLSAHAALAINLTSHPPHFRRTAARVRELVLSQPFIMMWGGSVGSMIWLPLRL